MNSNISGVNHGSVCAQAGRGRRHMSGAAALAFAALVATGQASAQDGVPGQPQGPGPAIAVPFKQWWDFAYTVRSDGLVDYRERREILVGSQNMAQVLGQLRLNVNEHFFDLEIVEAATLKADGRRIDVAPDKILTQAANPGEQAIFEADAKLRTVIFSDLAVGDRVLIVARFHQKRELLPGGFSHSMVFSPASRIVAARVSFDVPKDMKLHVFADRLAYATEASGERVRHVWTYTEQPYRPEEPSAVLPLDRDPRVLVSTFRDWEAAGLAYWTRAAPKSAPTPAISALAEEITKGITDRREQARAISDWVTGNIRYVAIALGSGAWVPHDAASVLTNRYGDCKDHTTLMRAMLTAKGIESEFALINQRAQYRAYDVPTPSFDHVILYLPEFGIYTDPTAPSSAFGVLPAALFDKPVLRSGPKGITVARTPPATIAANRSVMRVEINIAPDGSAEGTNVIEGVGIAATSLRSQMARMESQDPAELATRNLNRQGFAGTARYELRSPRDRAEPYAVKASFTIIDKVFSRSGIRQIVVGPRLIGRPVGQMRAVIREGRKNDFVCLANAYREEIVLKLPEGRTVSRLPPDVSQSHALGEYTASYRRAGQTVTVTREVVMRPPGSVCKPETAKALEEVLAAADADFRKVIWLLEPAPGKDGKTKESEAGEAKGRKADATDGEDTN